MTDQDTADFGALTVDEVFHKFGISRSRGYKEIKSGRLKTISIGDCRRVTVNQVRQYQALLEHEAEQRAKAGEKPRPRGVHLKTEQKSA